MITIHPQSLVESDQIGDRTAIWAFAHVMQGARIGSDCNIGDHAFVETGAEIGNRVTIKNQVLVWDGIKIEDDVFVGPRVSFTNDRFPRSPRMTEAMERYSSRDNWLSSTIVRQGCSIGAGAIICPGLDLGQYCVIGAGAVVTKNVPAFALVVGNPAQVISYVCTCGQRLKGSWELTRCDYCGEEGCKRADRLNRNETLVVND